ncbi:MAG TPA: oxygenase MpaB family protein [Bosea sp. (in: a-proteobacteria)]|jgi:uncharacterized protein (DUF2236 family)|uniref:oxygenase MpaB family protein n=1 Tax=Bosea sp. (in: a-proteobacteria) TaxID=1871050 RepID=UPI002E14694F|nr:oxygenase MpaB family protein [Bosea sp. (in: a-proteobacteria)]
MLPILMPSPLPLPGALARQLDTAARELLQPAGGHDVDFSAPAGEAALSGADSVSWQVFKNPVALFIGGVAAVLLELAEPRVRTGVWDYSSFRREPVRRLRRTGLAAMVTVYAARSTAEAMIAGVVRRHDTVAGRTPEGVAYRANDPELLDWVQATAGFGFSEAYHRYVRPLSTEDRDRFYAESVPAARLYGASTAPRSTAEMDALFERTRVDLAPSPIIFEFLDIMNTAPIFPAPLRPFQRMLVRAAVSTTPGWLRERLGLGAGFGIRRGETPILRLAGQLADRLMLRSSPAVQACRRLGLREDHLYRRGH